MSVPKINESHLDQVVSFLMTAAILTLTVPIAALIAVLAVIKIALSIWS